MAKRTKLTAPSAAELAALDADFRSEKSTRPSPATAPIAQIAAEAAASGTGEPAQVKLNRIDAEALREAREKGLIISEIPLDQINADAFVRDRSVIDKAELDELAISIKANGLRMPVEIFPAEEGGYNLISGYRRLMAMRQLAELNGAENFPTIMAFIRPPQAIADTFVAMVEENEIRSELSHFERGRIAVIAAQQGIFANTEAAVKALFNAASAAKRSKIKSFAEVFEVLGDMLVFPETLSERRGLRIANALGQGAEAELRNALEETKADTPDEEWAQLEAVIAEIEAGPVKVAKRGRKKLPTKAGWDGRDVLHLSSGISLRKERDSQGYVIRLTGKGLSDDLIESAMVELQRLFEAPK